MRRGKNEGIGYVSADDLLSLVDSDQTIMWDNFFEMFTHNMEEGTVKTRFYWLGTNGDSPFT